MTTQQSEQEVTFFFFNWNVGDSEGTSLAILGNSLLIASGRDILRKQKNGDNLTHPLEVLLSAYYSFRALNETSGEFSTGTWTSSENS